MTHFHLDLHVNKHAIGTIIVSSLTVIAIAALEYTHLNSALAYEKESIVTQFNNEVLIKKENNLLASVDWTEDVYSDEADLNSAEEIPEEVKKEQVEMEKSLSNVLEKRKSNKHVKKAISINKDKKKIVLERIEAKIKEMQSIGDTNKRKYHKRLGHLLAAKALFSK